MVSQRKTDCILLVTELLAHTRTQQSLPTCNIFKTIENEKKEGKKPAQKSQYGMGQRNIQILHPVLAQSNGN